MKNPFILGLTGSIGMGKSTTAQMFADLGCAVWDADAAVARLYQKGGLAAVPLSEIHSKAVVNGAVSRDRLKEWIATDSKALSRIEAIVHPLVASDRQAFVEQNTANIIVLDIPLLFENGTQMQMDAVAVVSVPSEIQRKRVLARGTMSEDTFNTILSKQMPDAQKRARADIVIPTLNIDETRQIVADIVKRIKKGTFHA
ncbi:dephospho-CoA kinase [Falsihalocynthiibacter sp. BN13B15]|uniref:dephospho-CoA kinase n=1 Tax=Falsihalocynthiibacter sp. BN13B15 TaxID=3240871 RepID=UPI00350F0CB0